MRLHSLVRRRPSPAIVISTVALFLSLGGVGYAATQLPRNSVGSRQIRNEAVTYKKIRPSSVGIVRANTGQLQVRVGGNCSAGTAIGAIDRSGHVTCNSALPTESGTTNNTAGSVGSTAATVTSVTLPSGSSYLAFANPTATVTPAKGVTTAQHVTVTCTLTVGTNTETRSVTIDTPGGQNESASMPLQAGGPSGTAAVSCTSATAVTGTTPEPAAPSVSVTAAVNAIQTAHNS
ncbi:MAG: hypothetical protein ACRDMJ_11475 [Solirubrobacteraceae bacterium]